MNDDTVDRMEIPIFSPFLSHSEVLPSAIAPSPERSITVGLWAVWNVSCRTQSAIQGADWTRLAVGEWKIPNVARRGRGPGAAKYRIIQ
jgi:hypothetical protein